MGRGPWGVSIHAFSALRCSNEIASTGYPVAVKAGEESNRINKQVRARDETVRRTHDPSRRICCQQRPVMDDLLRFVFVFPLQAGQWDPWIAVADRTLAAVRGMLAIDPTPPVPWRQDPPACQEGFGGHFSRPSLVG